MDATYAILKICNESSKKCIAIIDEYMAKYNSDEVGAGPEPESSTETPQAGPQSWEHCVNRFEDAERPEDRHDVAKGVLGIYRGVVEEEVKNAKQLCKLAQTRGIFGAIKDHKRIQHIKTWTGENTGTERHYARYLPYRDSVLLERMSPEDGEVFDSKFGP